MIINLKLFAAARQAVDQELLELELADGATITDLKDTRILKRYTNLRAQDFLILKQR